MSRIECGIQLYTLRKYTKNVSDIPEVFKRVKLTGATNVQISAMCEIDAKVLDKIAKNNGLSICCTHSPISRIINDLDRLAEEHLIYGAGVIGIGMMPAKYRADSFNRLNEFIDLLNEASLKLKKYNLKIAYHNHQFEFKDYSGSKVYDILIEKTLPEVDFILDTFWVRFANQSVIDYMNKLNGRISVLHLKDYKKLLFLPMMCALGRGELDFVEIIRTAENIGTRYAVIEQDFSFNPYKSIQVSMDYLKDIYIDKRAEKL